MDVQEDLGQEDSVEIVQFAALAHRSFEVGESDLFCGDEEGVSGLEELDDLDGVLHLGVLEFLEIPGYFRGRRE